MLTRERERERERVREKFNRAFNRANKYFAENRRGKFFEFLADIVTPHSQG